MVEHMLKGYALIMLCKNNQVLLIKRSDSTPFGPGKYSLIGGSLEKNESYRQALVREVKD